MASQKMEIIDGIECYASELIQNNDFYPDKDFAWLHQVEDGNFWFRARNKILHRLFKRYVDNKNSIKVLEIGCGTGVVLKMLSNFKNIELFGAEISLDYLKFVKNRMPQVKVLQLDATNMPFTDEFDVICAFDIIEHITADNLALKNIHQSLKPNGLVFITVPQHKWLWSSDDDKAFHKRRYSRKELLEKVKMANFDTIFCSSFVFTLLPFMAISRWLKKKNKPEQGNIEFALPAIINKIFYLLMLFDLLSMKLGLRLPAGGSLVVVARKK